MVSLSYSTYWHQTPRLVLVSGIRAYPSKKLELSASWNTKILAGRPRGSVSHEGIQLWAFMRYCGAKSCFCRLPNLLILTFQVQCITTLIYNARFSPSGAFRPSIRACSPLQKTCEWFQGPFLPEAVKCTIYGYSSIPYGEYMTKGLTVSSCIYKFESPAGMV